MSIYAVPEAPRFEFTVPGDSTTYSIAPMLDLPEDKIQEIMSVGDLDTKDIAGIRKFADIFPVLADDDATADALRSLTIVQKIGLLQAYMEASNLSLGESPAS